MGIESTQCQLSRAELQEEPVSQKAALLSSKFRFRGDERREAVRSASRGQKIWGTIAARVPVVATNQQSQDWGYMKSTAAGERIGTVHVVAV